MSLQYGSMPCLLIAKRPREMCKIVLLLYNIQSIKGYILSPDIILGKKKVSHNNNIDINNKNQSYERDKNYEI